MNDASEHSVGHDERLGNLLRSARTARGLELSDVAETTHVRKVYLEALEEGRWEDLPEDIYTRNFLRLYAQAVGLDADTAVERYQRERGWAVSRSVERPTSGQGTARSQPQAIAGTKPGAAGLEATRDAASPLDEELRGERRATAVQWRFPQLGTLFSTVLMVAGVVGLALWGFNATFFNPGRGAARVASTPTLDAAPSGTVAAGAVPGAAVEPVGETRTVRLSVVSTPPGAEVTVDEFPLPGVTPIVSAPVTARQSRVLRVALDGYEPIEMEVDLSFDRNLSFALSPATATPSEAAPEATVSGLTDTAEEAPEVTLRVTESTWLEVYRGTTRNGGERLVFTTAEPGQSFTFPLPVYVHTGNAAGVRVSVAGQDRGAFGSAGEVTGRPITQ